MSSEKKAKKSSRRDALVDAATDVFLTKGYDGTSLDEIIVKAGGSKRNVYSYFGGKAGLFGAVISKMSDELVLAESLNVSCTNWHLELSEFAEHFVTIIFSTRAIAFWRMMIASGRNDPDAAKLFMFNGPLRAQRKLEEFLSELNQKDVLRVGNPEDEAADLLAMLRGQRHVECLVGLSTPPDVDELQKHAKDTLRRFLLRFETT